MRIAVVLLAVSALLVGIHAVGRADPPAGVARWEYKFLETGSSHEGTWNVLGSDGWEFLVADVPNSRYVFKRPKK
jgi:hypothetical protein